MIILSLVCHLTDAVLEQTYTVLEFFEALRLPRTELGQVLLLLSLLVEHDRFTQG